MKTVEKKKDFIKDQKGLLILQDVEKLKIMGFTNVTMDNIVTDGIYHLYFLNFLNNMSNSKNEEERIAIKELRFLITKLFRSLKGQIHYNEF